MNEEFVISTPSRSYTYMSAIEKLAKEEDWDVTILRTEGEPFPGIVILCSKATADKIMKLKLEYVKSVEPVKTMMVVLSNKFE